MTKEYITARINIDVLCNPVASARYWQSESAYCAKQARIILFSGNTTQFGIAAAWQYGAASYAANARKLMGIE